MNLTCIAKLIKQKLIFSYIIEKLIGDQTNSVRTWLVCEYIKDLKISHDIDDMVIFYN
jgi:hypothetical protein